MSDDNYNSITPSEIKKFHDENIERKLKSSRKRIQLSPIEILEDIILDVEMCRKTIAICSAFSDRNKEKQMSDDNYNSITPSEIKKFHDENIEKIMEACKEGAQLSALKIMEDNGHISRAKIINETAKHLELIYALWRLDNFSPPPVFSKKAMSEIRDLLVSAKTIQMMLEEKERNK